ncbi:MmyB family transcriptional regulator [Nocardia macrotermitis]|uniref:MmyB-like transcription regulator ligand binding domain-containing protein n=1 Tax=Nocardia macrotermitis TaxID=2585198 RepID=A0A7K0DBL5_9NOCA|nr:helix-turn-helix domain-containing protein [Nocardia macrotermitis]MQY23009.1 hypothetical protein [Nocardia macrotermitis]
MNTEHGGAHPKPDTVIHLANWTRAIREHKDLTRRKAEKTTSVSWHYLKDIENNQVIPGPDVLESLIAGYQLDRAQARLTRDLRRPPTPLPSVRELRRRIATPARLRLLTQLDPAHIALAYLDPLWNILTANATFFALFPGAGAAATENLARWSLPPDPDPSPAESVLIHPRDETRWLVGTLRSAFARYRDNPEVTDLYQQLSRNKVFNHHWHRDIHVAHGRREDQYLHVRDPTTRKPYTLAVQLTEITDAPEIRGFLAWPQADDPG